MAQALLALVILAIIAREVEQHGIWVLFVLGFGVFTLVVIRAMVKHHTKTFLEIGAGVLVWRLFTGSHPRGPAHVYRAPKHRARAAGKRIGFIVGLPLVLFGWEQYHLLTLVCVTILGIAASVYVVQRIRVLTARVVNHHRYVQPLHERLNTQLAITGPSNPREWIDLHHKRETLAITMPKNFDVGNPKALAAVEQLAIASVGMDEDADVTWHKNTKEPKLVINQGSAPPKKVTFTEAAPVLAKCAQDELLLAFGRGMSVLKFSLHHDSPHIGLSMGSGGGKSVAVRLMAIQVLNRGGLVVILDIKQISHPWARDLPNVVYARKVEQIHNMLVWLGVERDRRQDVVWVDMNDEGDLTTASVGARILVVFEEINATVPMLKDYWQTTKPKGAMGKSPALSAWGNLSTMGRQVNMNIIAVAQMLTANDVGGSAIRENLGVRMIGRYTWQNWKMMFGPSEPMPKMNRRPGRVRIYLDKVREGQVPFVTEKECRTYATSGKVSVFPREALEAADVPAVPANGTPLTRGNVPGTPTLVSLKDVTDTPETYEMWRKRMTRANVRPLPVDKRGNEHLYDEDELKGWMRTHA